MATFSVNGYQLRSNSAHIVEDVQVSQIQIVSPLGMSTLACTYTEDSPGNAEVALADYNLLLNGTHLNDGQLPDRIELFDLSWGMQGGNYISRVLNLSFKSEGGWCDQLFAIDQDPLPPISSPAQANAFLGASRFSLVDTRETAGEIEIQLDQIPGVSVHGVLLKLFEFDAADTDSFTFLQEFDATLADPGFIQTGSLNSDPSANSVLERDLIEHLSEQDRNDGSTDGGFDEFSF
ncbi:MAG: hypothetical protein OXC60_18230 [Litoreibacter sp.]|nr:hypothetical protein [Litoreibacter sp.]